MSYEGQRLPPVLAVEVVGHDSLFDSPPDEPIPPAPNGGHSPAVASRNASDEPHVVSHAVVGETRGSHFVTREPRPRKKRIKEQHRLPPMPPPGEENDWHKYVASGDTAVIQHEPAAVATPAPERPKTLTKRRRHKLRDYHDQAAQLFVQQLYIDAPPPSDDDLPRRPSDIVQGTEEHSDRDYARKDRKALRRRRCASALRTKHLRTDAEIPYLTDYQLESYGLKKYGRQLKAPKEDRNLKRLSAVQRNRGLLYHRLFPHRRRKRKYNLVVSDAPSESPASCGGRHADLDYFESTDSDTRRYNAQHYPSNSYPANARDYRIRCDSKSPQQRMVERILQMAPHMHNFYFGEGVVWDEDVRHGWRTDVMSYGKLLRCRDLQAKPKRPPRRVNALFNDMVDAISANPDVLFSDIVKEEEAPVNDNGVIDLDKESQEEDKVIDVDAKDKKKKDDEDSSDGWWSSEDEQTMPVFEWMKRTAAEAFYKIHKPKKKMKKVLHIREEESKEDKPTSENKRSYMNSKIMNMLNKQGFSGRLGKHEQGRREIVMHKNISRGGGIGSASQKYQDFYGLGDKNIDKGDAKPTPSDAANGPQQAKSAKKRKRTSPKSSLRRSAVENEDVIYLDIQPETPLPKDNSRRAILVDLECVFVGAHARRQQAFATMIDNVPDFPSSEAALFSPRGDLCDRECVEALMEKHNVEKTSENLKRVLEVLDDAFEKTPLLVLDDTLLALLREWSRTMRLAIFHIGTPARMEKELALTGLSERIVPDGAHAIDAVDIAPYVSSWRELLIRVGVPACQSLFLVPDRGLNVTSSAVIAAKALGSRSFVKLEGEEKRYGAFMGGDSNLQADCCLPAKYMLPSLMVFNIDFFLKKQKQSVPKRVLAKNDKSELWESGVEFFRIKQKGIADVDVFVRFDVDGALSWVPEKVVQPLDHVSFIKMKDNDFPGLFDPSDLAELSCPKKPKK